MSIPSVVLDSIDLTANDYMASLSDDGKVVAAYVTQL